MPAPGRGGRRVWDDRRVPIPGKFVVIAIVASAAVLAGIAATGAATKPTTTSAVHRLAADATTIKTLAARVTADEKALKTVQSTQQNQLCSLLQLHDEVSQLIAEVAALEAHKPKPAPASPATVC
jgi:hypothetical protein